MAEAMADGGSPPREVTVTAERDGGEPVEFSARVRIDTPQEAEYYRHGGILQYVLRSLLADGDGQGSIRPTTLPAPAARAARRRRPVGL